MKQYEQVCVLIKTCTKQLESLANRDLALELNGAVAAAREIAEVLKPGQGAKEFGLICELVEARVTQLESLVYTKNHDLELELKGAIGMALEIAEIPETSRGAGATQSWAVRIAAARAKIMQDPPEAQPVPPVSLEVPEGVQPVDLTTPPTPVMF